MRGRVGPDYAVPTIHFAAAKHCVITSKCRCAEKSDGEERGVTDQYNQFLDYVEAVEHFKDGIRTGKLKVNEKQIKAILRVFVMLCRFGRMEWIGESPDHGWSEEHLNMMNQPYWAKICKQAEYALSLIRLP